MKFKGVNYYWLFIDLITTVRFVQKQNFFSIQIILVFWCFYGYMVIRKNCAMMTNWNYIYYTFIRCRLILVYNKYTVFAMGTPGILNEFYKCLRNICIAPMYCTLLVWSVLKAFLKTIVFEFEVEHVIMYLHNYVKKVLNLWWISHETYFISNSVGDHWSWTFVFFKVIDYNKQYIQSLCWFYLLCSNYSKVKAIYSDILLN